MRRIALLLLTAALATAQIVGGGNLSTTVATAGTAVHLSANNIQVKSFSVQLTTGTATFCVGGSTVSASAGTGACVTGTTQNIFFPPLGTSSNYDLYAYYVDATSNSTVVTVTYNVAQ